MEIVVTQTSAADRVEAAALRLFATRGFEGTGIRLIAGEAKISLASLYNYMGTKEDLLGRLMQKSMRNLLDPAQEIIAVSDDPERRLMQLVDLHVRRHAEDNLLMIVGDTEIRSLTESSRRNFVALRDAYEGIWEDTVRAGVASGTFTVPDVKLATFALLQMCTGVSYWYSPRGRLSLDSISDGFVGMALNLLRATSPESFEYNVGRGASAEEEKGGHREQQ
jgi:AcrR family transcriptional regulator